MTASPFRDASAIVTGAASGIGRAVTFALSAAGAQVLAVDVDQRGLDSVVGVAGPTVVAHAADVADPEQVRDYVDAAVEHHGPPGLFFNNAGVAGAVKPVTELSVAEWRSVLGVNLDGMFYGLKYVLPQMYSRGRGAVVNTGSVASLGGAPDRADYVATKHAVLGLTRSVAAETRRHGVTVNCLCPGPVNTEMVAKFRAAAAGSGSELSRAPSGLATPEEVAETVLFLLRSEVPFLTGAAVPVDGGLSGLF